MDKFFQTIFLRVRPTTRFLTFAPGTYGNLSEDIVVRFAYHTGPHHLTKAASDRYAFYVLASMKARLPKTFISFVNVVVDDQKNTKKDCLKKMAGIGVPGVQTLVTSTKSKETNCIRSTICYN